MHGLPPLEKEVVRLGYLLAADGVVWEGAPTMLQVPTSLRAKEAITTRLPVARGGEVALGADLVPLHAASHHQAWRLNPAAVICWR